MVVKIMIQYTSYKINAELPCHADNGKEKKIFQVIT